jgi:HSP20 family molecular chaperone IbpA
MALSFPVFPAFRNFGWFFDDLDSMHTVFPRVNVHSEGNNLVFEFEVPRFRAEDITVTLGSNQFTITGRRQADDEARRQVYGSFTPSEFQRSYRVPLGYDVAKAQQFAKDGVFYVSFPKLPEPEHPTERALTTETRSLAPVPFDTLSRVKWPPKIKVDDSQDETKYTVDFPEDVAPENIELTLRGRQLLLSLKHGKQVTKKDKDGSVVFSETQSVNYSTPLLLPEGTRAGDISTALNRGVVTITVDHKHKQAATQQLAINV